MQNFFKSKLTKTLFFCLAFLFGVVCFKITTKKQTFIEEIISAAVKPISSTISGVHNGISNFFSEFFESGKFKEENELLKKEVAKTRKELIDYNNLKNENEQLKQALNIQKSNKNFKVEVANFVARNPNDHFGFTINIGENKGIKKGNIVLTKNGLVGTVTKTMNSTANVTTILGLNSQIPVIDSKQDEKGILTGSAEYSKDGFCVMQHLNKFTKCEVGDIISTFGGSNFPEDIPVGRIKKIKYEENGMSSIAIIEPFEKIQYVKDLVVIKN